MLPGSPQATRQLRLLPFTRQLFCATPAGTLGTLAGGSLLDAIGSSMRNALLLCAAGIGAGACLAVAAFWAAGSFALFALVFAAAQLAMFSSAVS